MRVVNNAAVRVQVVSGSSLIVQQRIPSDEQVVGRLRDRPLIMQDADDILFVAARQRDGAGVGPSVAATVENATRPLEEQVGKVQRRATARRQ